MAQSSRRSPGNRVGEDHVRHRKEGKFRNNRSLGDEKPKRAKAEDTIGGIARLSSSKRMIQCYKLDYLI